jgi:integrase
VTVHHKGERASTTVHSEADARALVQFVARQELAGYNVLESLRAARTPAAPAPTFPVLREALSGWLDAQATAGDLRASTVTLYKHALARWLYPEAGDLPINQITRETIGSIILKLRAAGRGRGAVDAVVNPMRRFFAAMVETKMLTTNPAADLRFFLGKRRKPERKATFFTREEGKVLLDCAQAIYPRWRPFIMCSMLAGLRWGEVGGLFTTDIDWHKGRLNIQRTISGRNKLEPPKDHATRWVKASPALLEALRQHVESMALEASVKGWTPEQRQLVFPNPEGRLVQYVFFTRRVWMPLLKRAMLPYRKYHATRHTFASWMLEAGADIRWVQAQLGHSSITMTVDTYGHLQVDRHEHVVVALDRIVGN